MQKSTILVTLCGCLISLMPAQGQSIDARQVIMEAMNYVKGLPSLSVEMVVNQKINIGGKNQEMELKATLMMRGEKDLYLHVGNPASEAEFFSNSQKQIAYLVTEKQYLEKPSPRKELLGLVGGGMLNLCFVWLSKFLHADDSLLAAASSIEYAGVEPSPADPLLKNQHIRIKTDKYDLDAWLSEGANPLLQRFTLNVSQGMGAGSTATGEVVLSKWQINPSIPDDRFAFTPPADAKPYESKDGEGGKDAMIGKPAPPLVLDLMGGGKLDLASHKGKNVVILDFFATWCGPCRMAMPIVAEVAKQYESKGVLLYAVNLGEPEEKIKAFLEKSKINVTVALDKKKEAGMDYRASSIPRMVIVDKEGIVREAHNGLSPTFKEDLPKELDAILTGKAPAESQ